MCGIKHRCADSKILILAALAGSLLVAGDARASGDREEPSEPVASRFSGSGDLRLRYEGFSHGSPGYPEGRTRMRYRLRLRGGVELADGVSLHGELRSGNPDNPVSDNQTFDGEGSKKDISIAQAQLAWSPDGRWAARFGKLSPKELWWASDMQYDNDVVPEGMLARWEGSFGSWQLDLSCSF